MKNTTVSFVGLSLFLVAVLFYVGNVNRMIASYGDITDLMASLFFVKGITIDELHNRYEGKSEEIPNIKKLKILVVPGHFPDRNGAEFGIAVERNMAVSLGKELTSFLESNERFEVILARDDNKFIEEIDIYIENNKKEIEKWRNDHEREMEKLVGEGTVLDIESPPHSTLKKDDAIYLYGINKWANENNVALVINIHINDYPRKNLAMSGKYYGFTIYVPENQYGNAESSKAVADNIASRLKSFLPSSNMPKEGGVVVGDQDLIALGRFNTAKTASLLIEYGYIYEPMFRTKESMEIILKEMAYQTFLGIEEFFNENHQNKEFISLPHEFSYPIKKDKPNAEALLLQLSLISDGFYPPEKKNFEDCPLTGIVAECTKTSLKNFQENNGLKVTGIFDEETIEKINQPINPFTNKR